MVTALFTIILSAINNEDDKSKVERLFTKYRNLMLNVAYGVLNDRDGAAEAVQETAIKIIKYLHKIDEENKRKTCNFLATICFRTALNMLKKKEREKGLYSHSYDELDEQIEDIGSNPMDIVISTDSLSNIRKEIIKLPKIYRDILLLKDAYEFENHEISELLIIPLETVKTRLKRARKAITPQFVKEGLR